MSDVAEFLAESNRIEGYNYPANDYAVALRECDTALRAGLAPGSVHVINSVLAWRHLFGSMIGGALTIDTVLATHAVQMTGLLPKSHAGHLRPYNVTVGGKACMPHVKVEEALLLWIHDFQNTTGDALTLHYGFERVHPFVDGNGRVGRLLYGLDLVRRNQPLKPILNQFDQHGTGLFNVKRQAYYDAIGAYCADKGD